MLARGAPPLQSWHWTGHEQKRMYSEAPMSDRSLATHLTLSCPNQAMHIGCRPCVWRCLSAFWPSESKKAGHTKWFLMFYSCMMSIMSRHQRFYTCQGTRTKTACRSAAHETNSIAPTLGAPEIGSAANHRHLTRKDVTWETSISTWCHRPMAPI